MQFSKIAALLTLFAVGAVAIPTSRGGSGGRRGGGHNDNSHNNDNSHDNDNSSHSNTSKQNCSGGHVVCKRGDYFFKMVKRDASALGSSGDDNSDNCSSGDTYCCSQAGDGYNYCTQGGVTVAPAVEILRLKI